MPPVEGEKGGKGGNSDRSGDETDDTTLSWVDSDGDGLSPAEGDCDDGNAEVYPGAEDLCDGIDQDCDGEEVGVTFVNQQLQIEDWTPAFESGTSATWVELTFDDPGTLNFCGGTWYADIHSAASSLALVGFGGSGENTIGSSTLSGAGASYAFTGLKLLGSVESDELSPSTYVDSISMSDVVLEGGLSMEVENVTLAGVSGTDVWGGGLKGGEATISDCALGSLSTGSANTGGATTVSRCVIEDSFRVNGTPVTLSDVTAESGASIGDGSVPAGSVTVQGLRAAVLTIESTGTVTGSGLEVEFLSVGLSTYHNLADVVLAEVLATGGLRMEARDVSISGLEVTGSTYDTCGEFELVSLDLSEASFSGCTETGLSVTATSDVRLVGVEVTDAPARGIYIASDSGAVDLDTITVSGSGSEDGGLFGGLPAEGYGGGIYASTEGTLTAVGLDLHDNVAEIEGGGAWLNRGTISSSTFTNNRAGSGGGLYSGSRLYSEGGLDEMLDISDSVFEGNIAEHAEIDVECTDPGTFFEIEGRYYGWPEFEAWCGAAAGSGGAIYGPFGATTLTRVRFTGNTARLFGGAMYAPSGYLVAEDSEFSGNSASFGGALSGANTLSLRGTVMSGNVATEGGAIFVSEGPWGRSGVLTLEAGTEITGNEAELGGGVLLGEPAMMTAEECYWKWGEEGDGAPDHTASLVCDGGLVRDNEATGGYGGGVMARRGGISGDCTGGADPGNAPQDAAQQWCDYLYETPGGVRISALEVCTGDFSSDGIQWSGGKCW